VVEDLDSSADEAVGDTVAAVDVGSFHDDAVLDLCVLRAREHPCQKLIHGLLLVHVKRGLHVADRKSLDVDEEQRLVAEDEALLASAEPDVGVSEAPAGVVGVPNATRGEAGAVEAGSLDEVCGRQRLVSPEPQSLLAEPSLEDAESLGSDATLHLGEVCLAGGPVSVSADLSDVGVAPEALDEALYDRDLLYLAEHKGSEVPFGVVYYWSSRVVLVEPGPEDGVDRS
jgi:hypothetical protein